MSTPELTGATWRKSTFSGDNGQCVEVARLADGRVAMRNSKHPGAGTLVFGPDEFAALLKGCKAGHFDNLAS